MTIREIIHLGKYAILNRQGNPDETEVWYSRIAVLFNDVVSLFCFLKKKLKKN